MEKQKCGIGFEDLNQVEGVAQVLLDFEETFLLVSELLQELAGQDGWLALNHDLLEVLQQEVGRLHQNHLVVSFQRQRHVVVFDEIAQC